LYNSIAGRLSSVSPSRGHIFKTKQDRRIVPMEHCIEVDTADSVVAFRSFLDRKARFWASFLSQWRYYSL